ncbi:MAG: flagellin FliC [Planctomycetes bacterium]|nr:flagellin FliC [Planctomycetota bacterium]
MGLRIGTNVSSLTAQRNLQRASESLNRNFEHLSTGKRIARASDDAAGLAISSRFGAQIRGVDQAIRNANDGISLVQTAEGALSEIESTLIRMREISVQANNGTLSNSDRDNLQEEFTQLRSTVDQVANSTNFNGLSLLNTASAITLQIGAGTTAGVDTMSVSMASVTASSLAIGTLDVGSTGNASAAIVALDTALDAVTSTRGDFGAVQNRLGSAIAALQVRSENLSAARSRIIDVDVALETANLTKNSILQQAAISVLAQANQQPSAALSLLG